LNTQLKGLRAEVARDYLPAAEIRKRRRRAAGIVVVAMLGALAVENSAINRCFISPPHGAGRRVCSAIFLGYEPAMRKGDERAAQFAELLEAIPRNQQDVAELNARVEKLERRNR